MNLKCFIRNIFLFTAILFFVYACKRDGFLVSESGLHYTIHEKLGRKKPVEGDMMLMHLLYKNSRDSVIFDSHTMPGLFAIELIKPSFRGGMEEAFAMLGEGDSASFIVCADSLYDKIFHVKRPPYIHKGEKLRFDVRINKILTKKEYQSMMQKQHVVSSKDEDFAIREYLAENNIFIKARPSGFVYLSFVDGKGRKPIRGSEVEINYTGSFLNGEIFDATDSHTGPMKFSLGDGTMIPAWEEGISLMKEGGKARFVIPSRLAYGDHGYGPIKPNTPIVYDVVLVKVK